MTLAEMQRRFWELATRAPEARPASECFVDTPELDAEDRLSIYADMFWWRQIDALGEDFPKLAALLGDEAFYATAEAYLRAHPSTHPSLSQLGKRLAGFLAEREGPRPDLADLALLEWTRCQVFDEADAPVASAALLHGRADAASLRPRIAPTVRLLSLRHDVVGLWKALDDEAPAPPPRPAPSQVAVWRKELVVFHAPLQADEAAALQRALAGATLGEICEGFADVQPALAAVASWFAEHWIVEEAWTG